MNWRGLWLALYVFFKGVRLYTQDAVKSSKVVATYQAHTLDGHQIRYTVTEEELDFIDYRFSRIRNVVSRVYTIHADWLDAVPEGLEAYTTLKFFSIEAAWLRTDPERLAHFLFVAYHDVISRLVRQAEPPKRG